MDSQNIFDLFGRQIKSDNSEEKTLDEIQDTIKHFIDLNKDMKEFQEKLVKVVGDKISSFNRQFHDEVNNFKSHIKKTENLVKAISLNKTYLGVGKRRIVNVSKSIDNNDVVIKSELNEVLDAIIKVGTDIKTLEKKIRDDFQKIVDGTNNELKRLNDEIVDLNLRMVVVEDST